MSEELEFCISFNSNTLTIVFEYQRKINSKKVKLVWNTRLNGLLYHSFVTLQKENPEEVRRLICLLEKTLAHQELDLQQLELLQYAITTLEDLRWINMVIGST